MGKTTRCLKHDSLTPYPVIERECAYHPVTQIRLFVREEEEEDNFSVKRHACLLYKDMPVR